MPLELHRAPIHEAFLNLPGKRMTFGRLMPHNVRMETNCRTASKPADIAIFLVVPSVQDYPPVWLP